VRGVPQEIPRKAILNVLTCWRRAWLAACFFACVLAPAAAQTGGDTDKLRLRGAYVLRAAGCITCHTDAKNGGQMLAGGRALETPYGTFYTPNITFDREHGIGAWQAQDFFRALRHGVAPDGSSFYPVFPYTTYTRMHREDMFALWVYLASVPTSTRQNKSHELVWYMRSRVTNRLWKWLFFKPGAFHADANRSERWNRGAYLVTAMAHCAECHTPRTVFGNLDADLAYAGARNGPEGKSTPNITPDKDTGIGKWSRSELTDYLSSGMLPDGDFAGSLMADVIDDGLKYLSPEDLQAIAEFITTLPPIKHDVSGGGG
jgi:mono/diheme cytochrome c family protein